MRIEFIKLLEKLGVSYALSPYETYPWVLYDEEKGITCSAEIRMGPSGEDLEGEIQLLHDEKDDDDEKEEEKKSDSEEDEDGEGTKGTTSYILPGGREQILWLRGEPVMDDKWSLKSLTIKGKDYAGEFHDWDEKGCEFFLACIESINMGELPDIDAMIEEKMKDDSMWGRGGKGRIGKKSPNIKPGSLLGMKK